jgi:hypothetical protein
MSAYRFVHVEQQKTVRMTVNRSHTEEKIIHRGSTRWKQTNFKQLEVSLNDFPIRFQL